MNESVIYANYASQLKQSIINKLWDPIDKFFKVLPKPPSKSDKVVSSSSSSSSSLVDVRELHGYTPWYFNIPNSNHTIAWLQVKDTTGFKAPFGLTTAEQRHPQFHPGDYSNSHECLWNGPVWPYATSMTLVALANVLQRKRSLSRNPYVSKSDYFDILSTYAYSHFLRPQVKNVEEPVSNILENTMGLRPWIDENIHPYTGDAIARTILHSWWDSKTNIEQHRHKVTKKGGKDRGKDYNHSAFIDLIISGLIGLKPSSRDTLVIHPLLPTTATISNSTTSLRKKSKNSKWSYFCLDYVKYHNRMLTIVWDEDGSRYNRGVGFMVFVDAKLVSVTPTLQRVSISLIA